MLNSAIADLNRFPPVFPIFNGSYDLLTAPVQAGWAPGFYCQPRELFACVAVLPMAHQSIPIRLVIFDQELGTLRLSNLLDRLKFDMMHSMHAEQYAILIGFPLHMVVNFRIELQRSFTQQLHTGDLEDYLQWVSIRLGPLNKLDPAGPLRRLLDPLLCVAAAPAPRSPIKSLMSFEGSRIERDFDFGAAGCAAIEALFRRQLGVDRVYNLEADSSFQKSGVDLIARSGSRDLLRIEVKTERFVSGNLVYEMVSNMTSGSPGWMVSSIAQVLISVLWRTGDVFIQDFQSVKNWINHNRRQYPLRLAGSPNQSYKSHIHLGKIEHLLTDVPEVIHLRLIDWLPEGTSVGAEPSLLPARFQGKTLKPNILSLI